MYFSLSISAQIALVLAFGVVSFMLLREREKRKQRGLFRVWPIRHTLPEDFDPIFKTGPHGPTLETEIRSVGAYCVVGGIGDFETWVICNLARKAETIFEFGTATGKTTYLLAANAPKARLTTLTLDPDELSSYEEAAGDDRSAVNAAKEVSAFNTFFYEGTEEAERVTQLFGDSKGFDHNPYKAKMELVFIDGSHARSYVESDTKKALEMVKPGGVVIWHDYKGPRRAKDVFAVLNSLSKKIDLVWIANTSFVAYRAPLERR
jgi:hypothetical protein